MKWTAGRIILVILQFACFFIVPIIFVWLQYSENTGLSQGYKWTVTGLLVTAFILVLAKKVWLGDLISKTQIKLANMETQALVTTEDKAIKTLKNAYKLTTFAMTLYGMLLPVCVFAIALLTCKALETGAIKLFGVLAITATSFGVGYILKFIEILTVQFKHEKKEAKK